MPSTRKVLVNLLTAKVDVTIESNEPSRLRNSESLQCPKISVEISRMSKNSASWKARMHYAGAGF